MTDKDAVDEAVDVLQQLGLKEYEAKCFVGLSRLTSASGTAKELSEITEVPRTRVYDAIRVLEAQGLVEIQHRSPQEFRAVPLSEATETLRDQYEARVDRLSNALRRAEEIEREGEDTVQEVWAMSGQDAIANRTHRLIDQSTEEVVLVLGDESLITEELVDSLNDIDEQRDLLVGAATGSLEDELADNVPDASTFISGLDWLREDDRAGDNLMVGRLLLVDRSAILVSSIIPNTGEEHAVFGTGFKNGLITLSRRVLAQGLVSTRDPSRTETP